MEAVRPIMFGPALPTAGATEWSALLAVFLFGLLGSTHCVGMCGGIVATLNRRPRTITIVAAPIAQAPQLRAMGQQLAYNGGRLASYTMAGLIAGATGSAATLAEHLLPIQQIAFVAGSLVMMVIGLQMIGVAAVSSALERAGQRVWPLVQPLARATLGLPGLRGAFAAGLAWGWVPCAMVYGVLALAIVSGHPVSGALIMLVFGLGTAPALIGLGWASAQGARRFDTTRLRRGIGMLIMAFALAGLARLDPIGRIHQFGEVCLNWIR